MVNSAASGVTALSDLRIAWQLSSVDIKRGMCGESAGPYGEQLVYYSAKA